MALYQDSVPVFTIRHNNMVMDWPDGQQMLIPLRIFRANMAAAAKVLAAYDAQKAEVIPLRRGGNGDHAASS